MSGNNTSNDPIAPKSDSSQAFAGPIACVTLISRSLDESKRFYGEVMEMDEFVEISSSDVKQQQTKLWALPENFEWVETVFYRSQSSEIPFLRILASEQASSPVRPKMLGNIEGGLSVGFASHDLEGRVEYGAKLGFETTVGIGALDMKRADGSPYQALECHFKAPDEVYALGVSRPSDLAPVGPIEPGKSVGGPCYTGQVMNNREETMRFYTEVLGYEIRVTAKDMSGPLPEQALFLPEGTTMDFLQVFSPGSTTGYFIVLDYGDQGIANQNVAPPHSGVIMWTFEVKSVAQVKEGALKLGCKIIDGPIETSTPYFGDHKAICIQTANGFLVECIEKL